MQVYKWLKNIIALTLLTTHSYAVQSPVKAQQVLNSDLALHFTCKQTAHHEVTYRILAFLASNGFSVLDRAALQKEHGVHLLDVDLLAIKDKEQIVTVRLFPRSNGSFSLSLLTKPPTTRDAIFEANVLRLLSTDLKCTVYQRSENINNASKLTLFESTIQTLMKQFNEAERLRGQSRT